jgi:hypothetical protein
MLEDPRVVAELKKKIKIDRKHDVPYVAGYSKDAKTIYIDRHLKLTDKGVNVEPYLVTHERTEKALIDVFKLKYKQAHDIALKVEREHIEKETKLSWKEYETHYQKYIKADEYENVEKAPPDLDLKPYQDEHDTDVLKRLKAAAK